MQWLRGDLEVLLKVSQGPLLWREEVLQAMIDFGFVVAAFVPLVLFWIFGENHLRAVWRLSLGLGVVPALAVLVWRLRMEEPTRYKKDAMVRGKVPYLLILIT